MNALQYSADIMPGSDRDTAMYQISRLCPTKFKINVIPALFAKTTQKNLLPGSVR